MTVPKHHKAIPKLFEYPGCHLVLPNVTVETESGFHFFSVNKSTYLIKIKNQETSVDQADTIIKFICRDIFMVYGLLI